MEHRENFSLNFGFSVNIFQGDSRSQIDLMTFGFLKKGFLDVDLSEFHVIDDGSQPEAEANVVRL